MGYPVPSNSPRINVSGRTIAVAAFDWTNPMGQMYKVGVYEQSPLGEWLELGSVAIYANEGDCLLDIQNKGGFVKYMIWLKQQLNTLFAKLFTVVAPPVVTSEPTTDVQARSFVTTAANAWIINVVSGVPVIR